MNFMLFNTDVVLWKNKRESELAKDILLRVPVQIVDGHVCHYREVLATFATTEEAEKVLAEAGWTKDETQLPFNYWKP